MKILIIYSSVHGHTREISERIEEKLQSLGNEVTLAPLPEAPALTAFDKVLFGGSIRHGKHRADLVAFMKEQQQTLQQRICGFFSVSLVARKPGKDTPETNAYMQTFLRQLDWEPDILEVVGGRLNYQGYGFMDRNIIRLIMWMTKGPTDVETDVTYTDWDKVDALAMRLHQA